ncbi:hypothetical protein [Paenibacillus lutrae]|uniref:Uncharacterized protein n=1 Tax=Paenibacillus lutrae TaxID=2078573 RepID=A0A7X3JXS6_9BACL|nr:hypothetical protein [Paenibacillus lutrae]MVO98358.1 hypothetical protein [Paenibacillus lutrae]
MRRKMISVMLISCVLFAVLPFMSASAAPNYPAKTITGQGTLKVVVEGEGGRPEHGVSPYWSVSVTNSSGQPVFAQSYGGPGTSYSYVYNLPYDTYTVGVYPSIWTGISAFLVSFQ